VKELDPYDQLLKIPAEVARAAVLVNRWVHENMPSDYDIRICGIGFRTFLCVEDMRREFSREVRISELQE
jgi:predicted DNA-binding protein (UPF0278 family)